MSDLVTTALTLTAPASAQTGAARVNPVYKDVNYSPWYRGSLILLTFPD